MDKTLRNDRAAARRTRLAATGALVALAAGMVHAEDLPVPSQDDWDGARQTVTLPSGQTIGYVEMGNTKGDPLILIHGYTDNSRSWSLLAPELANRHILALDLRGHGRSSAPDCCYTIMDFSHDLDGFMAEKGIAKADIAGHSLGSMTAAVFAARHPDKVGKLVLISTATSMPPEAGGWLWGNVPHLPRDLDPDSAFMKNWYWNPNPVPPDFLDRERTESAATARHVWTGVLEGLTMTDWTPYAARIEAPVLVLWGDQDGFFDAATQDHLRAVLPDARHETLAGYGHNMFWETPQAVGAMLGDFLSE